LKEKVRKWERRIEGFGCEGVGSHMGQGVDGKGKTRGEAGKGIKGPPA